MKCFWERRFLGAEAGIAGILILFFIIWFFALEGASHVDALMHNNRANIYRTTATISGTLLGFSITSTSVALGFLPNERLDLVRGSRHFPALWKTFFQTIRFLGCLTIVSLIGLVWDKDCSPNSLIVIPFLFFLLLSIIRLLRTIWIIEQLIKIITK